MNRRELIKLGSAVLGGMSVGMLAGCNVGKDRNNVDANLSSNNEKTEFSVTPKQTAPYEFSSPMPFDEKLIDEIADLNKTLTKGKITTLYSSFPEPLGSSIHPMLFSIRGTNESINSVDKYLRYVKYATMKGFKCVYTLNLTRAVLPSEVEKLQSIVPIFVKMKEAGINDIKITNPMMFEFFSIFMPDMNLHISTSTEYHSLQNYQYMLNLYPNIKSINISTDDNHNFELLDSMRKLFPDVKLELLVNESKCLKNCISRYYHPCTILIGFRCSEIIKKNPELHLVRNNLVHPWQLEYYSAIGVNNFKFTSSPYPRNNIESTKYMKYYLECVENGIDNYSANDLIKKIYYKMLPHVQFKNNYKLAKLIENLPDVNVLINNGARCASDCGAKCKYCFGFEDKIKKLEVKA